MSLQALQDLFVRHREGHTGAWRMGSDPQRTIYLEQGRVGLAQSTHPLDKLTTRLVERGKLTQAQLDYALQNLKPGTSIGRNLIEMGFITQRDLLEMAKSQVERVVWGALGTPEEVPVFEARDLDNSVVRLPLDTPFLLLMGVLHITDRERLLQILGPLEQRPDLAGRPLPELPLPPDLAKVAPLLDGRRSLLDLAREAGAEPMRLGAFALFLREMGIAQLKMAEPAFAPLPPPVIPPVLEAFPEPYQEPFNALFPDHGREAPPVIAADPSFTAPAPSSLFAAIEAAQRPTVNLDNLSEALDKSSETPEVLDSLAELPPDPAPTLNAAAPFQRAQHPRASGTVHMPQVIHEDGGFPIEEEAPRSRGWIWILLLLLASGAAWAGYRWSTAPGAHAPTPQSEAPAEASTAPKATKPELPTAESPKPEPPKVEAAKEPAKPTQETPAPVPAPAKGDWTQTMMKEGAARRAALPKSHWTLRLEVACQTETLAKVVELLKDRQRELFLLPLSMKDGRTCTQVYLGDYPTEADARKAIDPLPSLFHEPGARPKPYLVSAIPDKQ